MIRPKSIPEMRGMPPIDSDRERPFSAESYAVQYGIAVEDAEDLLKTSTSHPQMHRQILSLLIADPDLKRRALLLEGPETTSPEEEAAAEKWMAQFVTKPGKDA